MKKVIVLAFIALIFCPLFTFSQDKVKSFSNGVDYNDYIIAQQTAIGIEISNLIVLMQDLPEDKKITETQLNKVVTTCETAINNLRNTKTLENDFDFKENAIKLFDFYRQTMSNDYIIIVDELYKEIPDYDKMGLIFEKVAENEAVYDKNFLDSQTKLAEYYDFILVGPDDEKTDSE